MNDLTDEMLRSERIRLTNAIATISTELASLRLQLESLDTFFDARKSGFVERNSAPKPQSGVIRSPKELILLAEQEYLLLFPTGAQITTSAFSQWVQRVHPGAESKVKMNNLVKATFEHLEKTGKIEEKEAGRGPKPAIHIKL